MATEIQRLTAEAAALRVLLEEVVAKIPETVQAEVQTQVETEVAAKGVPREEYARRAKASGRRVAVGMGALLLVIVAAVAWNRVTLMQAQDQAIGDFRRLVVTCRTTGPALSAADAAYCNRRVPGFDQARARIVETAAKTRRNEQRLAHLEAEVRKLLE